MEKSNSYAHWALEPYCIAAKLRALRLRKRLTLARLAAETGLSTALLSKLETDRMIPTLPTLAIICRVYGVGLGYFFRDPGHHSLSITRKAHLEARSHTDGSTLRIPLIAPGNSAHLCAETIEIADGTPPYPDEPGSQTCALAYVLQGRLEFNFGGMLERLDAGDCAYMQTDLPFSWAAVGKERCRVLLVRPAPAA